MLASQDQGDTGVFAEDLGLACRQCSGWGMPVDATEMALCPESLKAAVGSVKMAIRKGTSDLGLLPRCQSLTWRASETAPLNFHLHLPGVGLQNGKTKTHRLTRPSWQTHCGEWMSIADREARRKSCPHLTELYFYPFLSTQAQKTPEMSGLRAWVP